MLNDHLNAGNYYKRMLQIKDSMADDRYTQAVAEMQVQFETQKKTAENLGLKQENLQAKLNNITQQRWLIISFCALGLVLVASSFIYSSTRSRHRANLAAQQLQDQKRLAQEVMAAEEKERRRIAGDLHDGVCQTLAAAGLQLKNAGNSAAIQKADELINQASAEIRDLSHQVTPELLLHFGLVTAMERTIGQFNDSMQQPVISFLVNGEATPDDEGFSLMLYRCFQELLNNIMKHAHATNVVVQLGVYHEEIELLVEDDGKGFEVKQQATGLGLRNLQSRVALYDGVFKMDSTPGQGSTAILVFKNWKHLSPENFVQ